MRVFFDERMDASVKERVLESIRSEANTVRIGCAAGFWGDTETAAPQLLAGGALDYLVFDYLAEITMSIMAGARMRGPAGGYATDFVSRVMRSCLADALQQRVRIVTNAGGLNPLACRDALRKLAEELGVAPKIAVVLGDELLPLHEKLPPDAIHPWHAASQPSASQPSTSQPKIELPQTLLSANAYLGAKPIADALAAGADIVITGRGVDSALVLGPLVHEHGWAWDDFDRLAQGSLAGHIIECGAQCTGGIFTDWEQVPDYANIGYPIAVCHEDGHFVIEKPPGTGGLITPAVIHEQLLYEIDDPQAYRLPDVVCDFSRVCATQVGEDRVEVRGARGRPPSPYYKVSATHLDGFKISTAVLVAGEDAARKARRVAEALLTKIERLLEARGLGPFRATQIDVLGAESTYGPHARAHQTREVVLRLAASHDQQQALKLLVRELPQAGTNMAPGFASLIGGRPQPIPMLRHLPLLVDKHHIEIRVDVDGTQQVVSQPPPASETPTSRDAGDRDANVQVATAKEATADAPIQPESHAHRLPLIALAHGRSGDKGDTCNIGILARAPEYVPHIDAALSAHAVARHLGHLLDPEQGRVHRYFLPGCQGWNFVLEHGLGGGGIASLRADPQGKAYAQQLLAMEIPVPQALHARLATPARAAAASKGTP